MQGPDKGCTAATVAYGRAGNRRGRKSLRSGANGGVAKVATSAYTSCNTTCSREDRADSTSEMIGLGPAHRWSRMRG